MNQLDRFISEAAGSRVGLARWIKVGKVEVYLRKRLRRIHGERTTVLDIANIGVAEADQGKGHFARFLDEAKAKSPWPLYVENVLDDRFAAFFERNGWKRDPAFDADVCFYQETHDTHGPTPP